ncbi:hypothetical protein HYS54_02100 [Candidatus Micrarchaeota archaeon]|nr:hypothetical protein [Candidatus Micrarchaeota archaeon]
MSVLPRIIRANQTRKKRYGHTEVTGLLNSLDVPFSIAIVRRVGNDVKLGVESEPTRNERYPAGI